MTRHRSAWVGIAFVLATAGALLQTPVQPARSPRTIGLVPGGAILVLQAQDFGSLVRDWNGSREKSRWLASRNYEAFSRSRLFLRLKDAYDEFATAAGLSPDMALVSDVAGTDSVLALYDIGKLEFLYVTRLPAARAIENALWRTRGNYEPREAAGTPFYARVEPESKRVVAFGVRDEYLLLATRQDLVASALALMDVPSGAPSGTATAPAPVENDGWYARAIGSAGAPGDLRLVMNLEALARSPHFRSYWIQGNLTELKQFRSAVADLVRSDTEIREERVLVRTVEKPGGSDAVGEVLRLVPDEAGLYRAWAAPGADEAMALIMGKVIATTAGSRGPDRIAPSAGAIRAVTGSAGDLETRIDEEIRLPSTVYESAALAAAIGSQPLGSMLHVEATRQGSDGVFVDRGSVVVLAGTTDWSEDAARQAVQRAVDSMWTKAHIGMRWITATVAGQSVSQLEGLDRLAVAARGRLLFFSNDPALLARVLAGTTRPASSVHGSYAAGFRHGQERSRFDRMMRLVDHAAAAAESHAPLFFSENLASLSDVLSRVDSASIFVRDEAATVNQTVTYRIAQ